MRITMMTKGRINTHTHVIDEAIEAKKRTTRAAATTTTTTTTTAHANGRRIHSESKQGKARLGESKKTFRAV